MIEDLEVSDGTVTEVSDRSVSGHSGISGMAVGSGRLTRRLDKFWA